VLLIPVERKRTPKEFCFPSQPFLLLKRIIQRRIFDRNVFLVNKSGPNAVFSSEHVVDQDSQSRRIVKMSAQPSTPYGTLHPAWIEFIRLCRQIQHGEIEQLKIQDGLPMLAETVRQKIRFTK